MKLKKIISGGQTGADREGLEQARKLGLETGGTAPLGWKTDEGPAPELADFGLVESSSSDYKPRTRANAKNSDCTLWFGRTDSPGFYCTRTACRDYGKEFYENPTPDQIRYVCVNYETVNVAGNRRRKNPAVIGLVQEAFGVIAAHLGK
jgi:hypothetical protein